MRTIEQGSLRFHAATLRRLCLAVITALAVISTRPASAFDEPLSRQHFERGRSLARLGKHRESIMEFELAYQANPRASILYNLAHEHRVLAEAGGVEEMRKSLGFYERYLGMMPNAPDRAEVRAMMLELRTRIESADAAANKLPVTELPIAQKAPVSDAPRTEESSKATPEVPSKATPEVPLIPAAQSDPSTAQPSQKSRRTALWIGVGVGIAVVAGTAIGLGVGLTRDQGPPSTSGGNIGELP